MSPIEMDSFAEKTKALTEEQKKFVIWFIPTKYLLNEIERRTTAADNKVDAIASIFEEATECERTLENMTRFLRAIKEVV